MNHVSGHNEISRSELPHGGVGLTPGVSDKSTQTIYDLASTFDKNYVNKGPTIIPKNLGFAGSTFNTDSKGTTNRGELFNGGVGKTKDNYDD